MSFSAVKPDTPGVPTAGRFSLSGNGLPTHDPVSNATGMVDIGADRKGTDALVHVIGRQTESITLEAVATAIVGGLIPYTILVQALKEAGKLDKLAAAIEKAKQA